MFHFRGKLNFNKSSILAFVFISSYYCLANFFVFDIFNLSKGEYLALFWTNAILCGLFSMGSESEKLSFLDDDNEYYKKKAEIKVGFYFAVIAFSIWYIFYEEFVIKMLYNSTSAFAVLAITISLGRLVTRDALSEESDAHKKYLQANFKQSKISALIYLFGTLISIAVFIHGTWVTRF
ncbi:hypothetical protein A7985_07960 [Pseudoalteromonas luteoviolacea]|uniref:Uncharacterized protein n=1 Tax=Pseudoalteromonas luteoviolacea TaxID=43657 RepID=A0A1C0TX20_9GAMM|nr:hypothetical protein [Pseudoalteromonas luteoviolacea]OCQ23863.1 hypothetical protein A7985_07960 [Pseudoalteromonas luteoviolacea]